MEFVNIHNHSEYSILDGMLKIDDLVGYAKEKGQPAIGITDHGVMGGFWKMYKTARREGVKPLIGCEFYLVTDINYRESKKEGKGREKMYHICAIAKNQQGLKNLFKLSTRAHLEGFYYKPRICMDWLKEFKEGLIVTSACLSGPLGSLIDRGHIEMAYKQAARFKEWFGSDFYIEIMPNKLSDQKIANPILVEIGEKLDIPVIMTTDAHYLKEAHSTHPILLGIQSGGKMWKFDDDCFHLMTGVEVFELARENHPLLYEKDIKKAIAETVKLAEKVENFEIKLPQHKIPSPYPELKTEEEEYEKLLKLVEKGWSVKGMEKERELPEYKERLEKELKAIKDLGFVRYFLMVYDLYGNCIKPKGIMYGTGRGSSAGSLVCCLLDITTPDPIKFKLIFERFIAPDRVTQPDIDMDFQDDRREEIKEWLIEKYGRDNVADIGTYAKLKGKMVLRDVSRVLGVPIKEVDELSQFIIQRSGGDERSDNTVIDTFQEFEEAKRFKKKWPAVPVHCEFLEGKIRQAGIHAAGVIVAPFDLTDVMPLERRSGKIVTALDGKEVDAMEFVKLDLLGLRTLTIIDNTLKRIGLTRQDLVDLDYNDQKVFDKFAKGDTQGVFQFNSIGLMDTLKEMPVNNFEDLVALNALYRPGGMRSGICGQYIERVKGEKYDLVGNVYDDITKDTYGLIVYQEQIMQVFGKMAGYNATNIDHMRRRVAKSHGVEEFSAQKPSFLKGCKENGIDEEFASDIFEKMVHFGSYAFNRSHAVVYTQIAYWTQWLKVYYPLEFYVSALNCESTDDKIRELLGGLEAEGHRILLPDINKSGVKFEVEPEGVRVGLIYIKGIGEKTAEEIIKNRPEGGYRDEEDLYNRANRRRVHKGILGILRDVRAWGWGVDEEVEVREKLASQDLCPLPILDREIKKARALAEYFDVEFDDIDDIDFSRNGFVHLRGIFSGVNYARVGDFGPPGPNSPWKIGDRYAMMDLVDGTAHIRVKFNPKKYEQYKDKLRVGKRVIVNGRVLKGIKMIFVQYMVELDEEKIKEAVENES